MAWRDYPTKKDKKKTGLYSLECRRQRGDLIETFKIVKKLENVQEEDFFTRTENTQHHPTTRGGPLKLFKKGCKSDIRKTFFSHRSVNPWNSLPKEIKLTTTVDSFKASLDGYWKRIKFGHQIDL